MLRLASVLEDLLAEVRDPAEDTRRLNGIRELLSHFDWEHDDLLALACALAAAR
jgi:hypothetical protein